MEPEEKQKRKIYTREFRVEAVRLATESGQTTSQVARDLGLNENTLWRWRRQFKDDPQTAFPGRGGC